MRTGTPPVSKRNDTESLGRQVFLLVVTLSALGQAATFGLDLMRGRGLHWEPVFGTIVCMPLIFLLMKKSIPVQQVNYGVLFLASLGIVVELLHTFSQVGPPPTKVYVTVVILFLVSFCILPALYAAPYSALLFAIFAALVLSKGGGVAVLINMGVIVMLIAYLSVFGQRVSAERAEARLLQVVASTDALTGLSNRRAMYGQIEQAFKQAMKGAHSALLLLDVDHFKNVNDTYGHAVGDLVLQRFALVLQNTARNQDSVSRWGGEEFLILISGVDESEAIESAHRFLDEIRNAEMHQGIRVTASGGVAHSTSVASTAEWMVQADERLYVAKNAGRDRVHPQRRARPDSTGLQ